MAMLLINDVFERTWGERAAPRPADEYWPTVIGAVQAARTRASSSWPRPTGTWSGSCSSRGSTSATTSSSTTGWSTIRRRACAGTCCADLAYQERLVRFIENHDEPRAAATFARRRRAPRPSPLLTAPGARAAPRGAVRGAQGAAPGLPRPPPGGAARPRTRGVLRAPPGAIEKAGSSETANGASAIAAAGRTTRAA